MVRRLFRYDTEKKQNFIDLAIIISVNSVVPKQPKSSIANLIICDHRNGVIPFHLLKNVISTYVPHQKDFLLRVSFGNSGSNNCNVSNVSSPVIFLCENRLSCLIVSQQELRKHFVQNNLKNLVEMGDKAHLETFQIKEIVRVAGDLLSTKHGPKPSPLLRKSFATSVHQIFPQVSADAIYQKLTNYMRNSGRVKVSQLNDIILKSLAPVDYDDIIQTNPVKMFEIPS